MTLCDPSETPLQPGKEELVMSLRDTPSLAECFAVVKLRGEVLSLHVGFYMDSEMPMPKWTAFPDWSDWSVTYQVVVASMYHSY